MLRPPVLRDPDRPPLASVAGSAPAVDTSLDLAAAGDDPVGQRAILIAARHRSRPRRERDRRGARRGGRRSCRQPVALADRIAHPQSTSRGAPSRRRGRQGGSVLDKAATFFAEPSSAMSAAERASPAPLPATRRHRRYPRSRTRGLRLRQRRRAGPSRHGPRRRRTRRYRRHLDQRRRGSAGPRRADDRQGAAQGRPPFGEHDRIARAAPSPQHRRTSLASASTDSLARLDLAGGAEAAAASIRPGMLAPLAAMGRDTVDAFSSCGNEGRRGCNDARPLAGRARPRRSLLRGHGTGDPRRAEDLWTKRHPPWRRPRHDRGLDYRRRPLGPRDCARRGTLRSTPRGNGASRTKAARAQPNQDQRDGHRRAAHRASREVLRDEGVSNHAHGRSSSMPAGRGFVRIEPAASARHDIGEPDRDDARRSAGTAGRGVVRIEPTA